MISSTDSGNSGGGGENIRVFGRLKPEHVSKSQLALATAGSKRPHFSYTLDSQQDDSSGSNSDDVEEPQLHIVMNKDDSQGPINNSRERFDFRFSRVFDQSTTQEEVFDHVAKGVVDSVLNGYNGTIFAYGQTGSGKTFTITGGMERYADRGLIPRTIQYIFQQTRSQYEKVYSISISYMEIYNESGYDLLDTSRDYAKLEDLPKVILQEDESSLHYRNLSIQPVNTEEEAFNLLFMGDTNKMIAETPSNPASSRSHCIFTIHVTGRRAGEEVIRKSKLNLVDLAGSERVSRTKIDGQILKEAKHINLSLHYLEQVIIALHEQSLNQRTHIPFRNSLMTLVLRDSLGGNCKTTMIATMSMEPRCIDETISTCRFAQRVALIKNQAVVNEELDLRLVVEMLRRQVEQLKAELALARSAAGGQSNTDEPLPDYEKERVRNAVLQFIQNSSRSGGDNGGETLYFSDIRKIYEAFRVFREQARRALDQQQQNAPSSIASDGPVMTKRPSLVYYEVEEDQKVIQLRQLVEQRDQEIEILVSLLNGQQVTDYQQSASKRLLQDYLPVQPESTLKATTKSVSIEPANASISSLGDRVDANQSTTFNASSESSAVVETSRHPVVCEPQSSQASPLLVNNFDDKGRLIITAEEKREAYELFKQTYPPYASIQEQKETLKQKYALAKSIGEQANKNRTEINQLKQMVEKRQMQRAIIISTQLTPSTATATMTAAEGENGSGGETTDFAGVADTEIIDRALEELRMEMEQKRNAYKDALRQLKETKTEVDHLQHCLDQARVRMQRVFEDWLVNWKRARLEKQNQQQQQQQSLSISSNNQSKRSGSDQPVSRPESSRKPRGSVQEEAKLAQALPDISKTATSVKRVPVSASVNTDVQAVQALLRQTGIKSSKVEQDLLAFYQAKRKLADNNILQN